MRKVLLLAVVLVACAGDSLCEDLIASERNLFVLASACEFAPSDSPPLSVARCEEGRDVCSDEELEALRVNIDCINRIPACVGGKESVFVERIRTCNDFATSQMSDLCLIAVFGPP